jgi:hypothetical protein
MPGPIAKEVELRTKSTAKSFLKRQRLVMPVQMLSKWTFRTKSTARPFFEKAETSHANSFVLEVAQKYQINSEIIL